MKTWHVVALVGGVVALPTVVDWLLADSTEGAAGTAATTPTGGTVATYTISAAVKAAGGAYPLRVAGVQVNKRGLSSQNYVAALWPQVRASLMTVHGRAGEGTRSNQPNITPTQAQSVVAAALIAFSAATDAGMRVVDGDSLIDTARNQLAVELLESGENPERQVKLNALGMAAKQCYAALRLVSTSLITADPKLITPLMLQNYTDAAQRVAQAIDDAGITINGIVPSIIDSLGVGISSLPDTLGDTFGGVTDYVGDKIANAAESAAGAVLLSTPVLLAGVAYAWWKLA